MELLRKVLVKTSNYNSGGTILKEAYFHRWNECEIGDYGNTETKAIIEYMDGSVRRVSPYEIQFVSNPENED